VKRNASDGHFVSLDRLSEAPVVKKQTPIIIGAVAVLGLVVAWFLYDRMRPACDSIFEQTTPKLAGKLDIIKTKGEILIGREKVQELAESSQKVALHLKTCCIAQLRAGMSVDQFQGCVGGAKDYETKIAQVSDMLNEAQAAKDQGKIQLAEQKTADANQAAGAVTRFVEVLVNQPSPGSPGSKGAQPRQPAVEQEPNNSILEANAAQLSITVSGEIAASDDLDYFKYHHNANLRDMVKVALQNLSSTLASHVHVYNQNKSEIIHKYDPTPGSNVELFFTADPGNDYYIAVAAFGGTPSNSKYNLAVVPQKAYDEYEPNGDAATAIAIKVGQSVLANILDGEDRDWYRIENPAAKEIAVRLDNMSANLRPDVYIYNQNKAQIEHRYETTEGANIEFSFPAVSGNAYYIVVSGYGGNPSRASYNLSMK
jgi:hypothetical protein